MRKKRQPHIIYLGTMRAQRQQIPVHRQWVGAIWDKWTYRNRLRRSGRWLERGMQYAVYQLLIDTKPMNTDSWKYTNENRDAFLGSISGPTITYDFEPLTEEQKAQRWSPAITITITPPPHESAPITQVRLVAQDNDT